MTYEEKFDIVIKAIVEAKKLARKGQDAKLYMTSDNGLKGFSLNELHDILLYLQEKEGVFIVQSVPSEIQKLMDLDVAMEGKRDFFLLEIKDGFDSWYERRLIMNKSRLENLSEQNLNNIIHIVHLIELELELDQSEKITISFASSVHDPEGYEREDIDEIVNTYARGLGYLKNIGVVKDYTTSDMTLSSEITLNIARFFELLGQVNNLEQSEKKKRKENEIKEATVEKTSDQQSEPKTDVVYWITYRDDRQILLNDVFKLKKPRLDGDNDRLFKHLYDNPNKLFNFSKLKEQIKVTGDKDLNKFVNNLGFRNDLKRVFFETSKDNILFRNNITAEQLQRLGIEKIELS